MIIDHVKYLKVLVEENIVNREGTSCPLQGKFYEVYPTAAQIKKSMPCAAIRHRQGKSKKTGVWDHIYASGGQITKTKRLYDTESVYQVDFYSYDLYDFLESDDGYKGILKQFMFLVASNSNFIASDGRNIAIECGVSGVIDDDGLIVDNVYKAFCQVKFKDAIYSHNTIPQIIKVNFQEGRTTK